MNYDPEMMKAYEAGRKLEAEECWKTIRESIPRGKQQGNGMDDTAQVNGMVICANMLYRRLRNSPENASMQAPAPCGADETKTES